MKRFLPLICMILALLPAPDCGARGGLFSGIHAGVEWGASKNVYDFHHYNYLDEYIGFRIDDRGWELSSQGNAFLMGSLGFDLSRSLNFRILCGWEGISAGRRVVPLAARLSYHPRSVSRDGVFYYAEGQTAVFRRDRRREVKGACAGAGYRFALTPHIALDFQAGVRVMYDEPDVWDPLVEEYISERNVKLSQALYSALNVTIALVF